VIPKVYTLR